MKRRGADRQLRPWRAGRPRGAARPASTRARSAALRSTSSPTSRSPTTRCSSATTSSSPRTWAPRPPRRRTAPGRSPPSRCARALSGGVVTNAVNIAAVRPEAMEALAPFVPLCEKLGRLAQGLGDGSIDRVAVEFHGRIAEHDTRLLGIAVLVGILSGHTEEPVNLVNAPAMAEERGIELTELKEVGVGGVHRAGHGAARVGDAGRGRRHRRSARATSRIWSGSGARASTCRSPSTSVRSSATRTSRG